MVDPGGRPGNKSQLASFARQFLQKNVQLQGEKCQILGENALTLISLTEI